MPVRLQAVIEGQGAMTGYEIGGNIGVCVEFIRVESPRLAGLGERILVSPSSVESATQFSDMKTQNPPIFNISYNYANTT